jgi:hypothetical protein
MRSRLWGNPRSVGSPPPISMPCIMYQEYLPAEARRAPLQTQPWGFKEFSMRDPSGNLLIFAEHVPEADAALEPGA